MAYPENDTSFEEFAVTEVRDERTGWAMATDGWWLHVPKEHGVEPKVGQMARFYPCHVGRPVRGLFLDGQKVWYRTDDEDHEMREIERYGKDAADWLAKWDDDGHVWSISMGGLGPGYEQCIQITTAEILRHFLAEKYDHTLWQDKDIWKQVSEATDKAVLEVPAIQALGLSGAQWGGAMNLATMLYMKGPRAVMNDPRVKDRKIQVGRKFPQAA